MKTLIDNYSPEALVLALALARTRNIYKKEVDTFGYEKTNFHLNQALSNVWKKNLTTEQWVEIAGY